MEEIKVKTFNRTFTEEEQKALYIKETILEIFENNTIYSDSEVFTKTIEYDGEDKEGNVSSEDIEFIIEDNGIYEEYEQIVKYELLEDIWNKAQKEILEEYKKKAQEQSSQIYEKIADLYHKYDDIDEFFEKMCDEVFDDNLSEEK